VFGVAQCPNAGSVIQIRFHGIFVLDTDGSRGTEA
jgi:hypothetical protein